MPGSRTCAACGRRIEWRKKWVRHWDEIRYCSERCRRSRPSRIDRDLEDAIVSLLDRRPREASICPSEAAKAVSPDDWEALMQRARNAARRLVASGRVEITQNGRVVEPSAARGPIRIRSAGVRH